MSMRSQSVSPERVRKDTPTAAEHANSRLKYLRTAFEVATLSSHYIAAATQRKPRYLAQTTVVWSALRSARVSSAWTRARAPERASGECPVARGRFAKRIVAPRESREMVAVEGKSHSSVPASHGKPSQARSASWIAYGLRRTHCLASAS